MPCHCSILRVVLQNAGDWLRTIDQSMEGNLKRKSTDEMKNIDQRKAKSARVDTSKLIDVIALAPETMAKHRGSTG